MNVMVNMLEYDESLLIN